MSQPSRSRRLSSGRPNDPPILILTSLASRPKHGYALLQDIEAFAGVQLGPGTLYGAIGRLEERGLIEAVAERGRARPYRLTGAGSQVLESALGEMRTIVAVGTRRLSDWPGGVPGPRHEPVCPRGAAAAVPARLARSLRAGAA